MRPNYKKLPNGEFLVRTQAGYRKAVRDFFGDLTSIPPNYPKSYPSVVKFWEELDYRACRWVHLNIYKVKLQAILKELENE